MQRKLAASLLGLAGLLALSAVPAAGQTAGSGAPANGSVALRASPAPGSTLDTAGAFALALKPGESGAQTLLVANDSPDRRLTVRVIPVDGARGSDGVRYASKATEQGSGSWLTASIGVVVVEPGAEVSVPFTIAVPLDAAAGDTADAALRVFAESAVTVDGAPSVVDDLPVLNVPVTIAVPGAPAPRLSVTSVVAAEKDGNPHLAVTVRNSGSVVTEASGTVKAPGGELTRDMHVRVEPRKEVTTLVEWQAIDVVNGAEVAVELEYGDGDIATWVGIVPADPESEAAPAVGDEQSTAPNGAPAAAPSGRGSDSQVGTILGWAILLMMVAAAVWFVIELSGVRKPTSVALDPASFPTLQVMMDPRHTQVLDALVTQVGALGGAIGTLAETIGVTVSIPPSPPLLGSTPGRRHRGRPRHAPNSPVATVSDPIVVQTSASATFFAPPMPTAGPVPPPRREPPPAHDILPKPSQREIADDIAAVTDKIGHPPTFIPPRPMPADWLEDDFGPSDAVAPPLEPLSPPPRRYVRNPPPPPAPGAPPLPQELDEWLRDTENDRAFEAFFDAPDDEGRQFWRDAPGDDQT